MLTIANHNYPSRLILGPLAGISCAPFRALASRYRLPAFSCTEMISAKTLLHQSLRGRRRFVLKDPREGKVCFQLASAEPRELAEATRLVSDLGADSIDLNCGCPVKKIRRKGAGSSLLVDPPRLYQLIQAMKTNTALPVSIKIRVEKEGEGFHEELVKVISEAGADFLVVHGRHWTEHYETPCRLSSIAFFVKALKIPVIGNGDVTNLASLKAMLATGCAGVMISRASVGQPWLVQQLESELEGLPFERPSWREIAELFRAHIEGLIELLGGEKVALLEARKLAKYYARFLPARAAFCEEMNRCESLLGLEALSLKYFR